MINAVSDLVWDLSRKMRRQHLFKIFTMPIIAFNGHCHYTACHGLALKGAQHNGFRIYLEVYDLPGKALVKQIFLNSEGAKQDGGDEDHQRNAHDRTEFAVSACVIPVADIAEQNIEDNPDHKFYRIRSSDLFCDFRINTHTASSFQMIAYIIPLKTDDVNRKLSILMNIQAEI